ncbi:uncharacterized protein P884DRAFT_274548 [Thermothelomyces heterothallicus CBS 202.75]|uniref:uncharacterized protein n=1 Tax=Thermothelomyces heterothallicus CBS 202.75 TaxID=1149848 RepID=UPI0037439023
MVLQSPEAAFIILSALSPSLGDHLALAGKLRARIGSSRGAKWALGVIVFALLFVVMDPWMILTGRDTAGTPYSLLGVTPVWFDDEITHAYHAAIGRIALLGPQLGGIPGLVDPLRAYHDAYLTLIDPLRRCVYHRDTGIPDWYGVPATCWGSLAVNRLRAAQRLVRARLGGDDPLPHATAALRLLKARFRFAAGGAAAAVEAAPKHPATTAGQQTLWAWQQAVLSSAWGECLRWLGITKRAAALSLSLFRLSWKYRNWLRPFLPVLLKASQLGEWAASHPARAIMTSAVVALLLVSGTVICYVSPDRFERYWLSKQRTGGGKRQQNIEHESSQYLR